MQGLGVSGFGGLGVWGLGFRVLGFGGLGFREQRGRSPKTKTAPRLRVKKVQDFFHRNSQG